MGEEDIAKGTRYVQALEDVAEAARWVEEVRVRYENAMDELTREQGEADEALRSAIARAVELTGGAPLPVSKRARAMGDLRSMMEKLKGGDG